MRSPLVLLGLCAICGCAGPAPSAAFRARAAQYGAQEDVGLARFLFDDFSGLSVESLQTYAAPWKVTGTALLLRRNPEGVSFDERGVGRLMERYGFVVPARVGNWDPRTPAPAFELPVGVVKGMLALAPGLELEVANDGCGTCHAGRAFDAAGAPTREVWIGLPNTSIDLEAYSRDLFGALSEVVAGGDDEFLAQVRRAFPGVSAAEQRAIRMVVLPRLRELVKKQRAAGSFSSYNVGQPGLSNGVAALEQQLGVLPRDAAGVNVLVSIPSLAFRDFKTSLLWDGVYAPRGRPRLAVMREPDIDAGHLAAMGAIPSIFTTTTLGISPRAGAQNVPRVREVFRSTARAPAPPFPGPVDAAKADAGEQVFAGHCQGCHGKYDRTVRPARLVEYPNKLIAGAQIGTDPQRWQAAGGQAVIDAFARSDFARYVDAQRTEGYVPPILTSTWATAPYLHNGSVPTLWHFFHPEARPARFLAGGHALDYEKVGIALDPQDPTRYPAGYRPTSRPVVYDTAQPGHGAQGHEKQLRSLSEDDKVALIEYLKLL